MARDLPETDRPSDFKTAEALTVLLTRREAALRQAANRAPDMNDAVVKRVVADFDQWRLDAGRLATEFKMMQRNVIDGDFIEELEEDVELMDDDIILI